MQTRLLAKVITTSRNMFAVADLQVLSREDLKRCFKIPLRDEMGELVAEALAVFLRLNEALMSQLKTARDQVAEEGNTQVRNLEAASEYQKMHPVR
jgi:hypothetical protein